MGKKIEKKKTNSSTLLNGDCLDVLKTLKANSVDSIVTDPPAGIAFMGAEWDKDKGGRDAWIAWMRDVMKEAMRALKPGGHALVWALPRTSHWTMTALEDAGFEIRDSISHIFGSGFPKSMDISKAVEAQLTTGSAAPKGIRKALMGDRYTAHPNAGDKDFGHTGILGKIDNTEAKSCYEGWKPTTDAAKQWQGWGTALKPAAEFWILCRKPCSEKTVAANVLKHGVGGINIDGSRVGSETRTYSLTMTSGNFEATGGGKNRKSGESTVTGRFPANLILSHTDNCFESGCVDDCAIKTMDGQSGVTKSSDKQRNNKPSPNLSMSGANTGHVSFGHSDSGGASRFFYCAKPAKKDKGSDNTHPTVKNTVLMDYLIKLITPPNGTVLDPFMGSGTTGVAAIRGGYSFVGIEREKEFFKIAKKRIEEVLLKP